MSKKVSILVGSLRKGSFARKVAQNVIPMFPEGYEARIVEIGHLPLYNRSKSTRLNPVTL